jgi:hypothetical protein
MSARRERVIVGTVAEDLLVCARCGMTAPAGDTALTWTTSVEGSGDASVTEHYCADCTREHVRGIEAKLDAAWW